jgi:lysyl-tRNA synthetase class 2
LDWRPGASIETLRVRADLLARIRAFFHRRGILEVETPLLARAGGTDPAIEPLLSKYTGPGYPHGLPLYLQTSPEFFMKRLLAAGSGPIFQICKAFRDGEAGPRHNPEFTLLEWYRPDFDDHRLMDELAELIRSVQGRGELPERRQSYAELFRAALGIDPLSTDVEHLAAIAARQDIGELPNPAEMTRDDWLDLLLTHVIEPALPAGELLFVYDYPASQAALARLDSRDPRVARRFELYLDGLELANGFQELANADEQGRRFAQDNIRRRARGQAELPVDQALLAALEHGIPDCAGVAVGLDRLLMLSIGARSLDEVQAFSLQRS